MKLASQWIHLTLVVLVVYLVVKNWKGATEVLRAAGNTYATSVNALKK